MVLEMIVDGLVLLAVMIYYQIEAMFRFFVRPKRKDVSGEVVLITGAGSGIGQKLAVEFAKLGSTIVGCDISTTGLEQTKQLIEREIGGDFHSFTCDLSKREAIYEMADKVKKDVGKVDILINNAGIVSGKKLLECPDALMQKTMEVNTMSHFWTLKAFLPAMLESNHGHVVSVASAAGFFGIAGQVDYAASKFGAVGLTEALLSELDHIGKTGVKVTLICPYYINTGMFDGVKGGWIPIMEKDDAVAEMVDGILREKYLLMIPRLVYLLAGLKNLNSAYYRRNQIWLFANIRVQVRAWTNSLVEKAVDQVQQD